MKSAAKDWRGLNKNNMIQAQDGTQSEWLNQFLFSDRQTGRTGYRLRVPRDSEGMSSSNVTSIPEHGPVTKDEMR